MRGVTKHVYLRLGTEKKKGSSSTVSASDTTTALVGIGCIGIKNLRPLALLN